MSWVSNSLEKNPFKNSLPSSILSYNNKLYATTADNNDGNVYESTNGIKWEETLGLFENEHVNLLLAPLSNKITYIKTINGTKVFASTNEITSNAKQTKNFKLYQMTFLLETYLIQLILQQLVLKELCSSENMLNSQ